MRDADSTLIALQYRKHCVQSTSSYSSLILIGPQRLRHACDFMIRLKYRINFMHYAEICALTYCINYFLDFSNF